MAYDRVLVLAATQDEATAFGRAFGLDVQFCTGAHNLFAHRVAIELESFADARKFQIQSRLSYWQAEPGRIHMYVAKDEWENPEKPVAYTPHGEALWSGIESTGTDTPTQRGTNADRAKRRALPEPQVDEEDPTMMALEGGRKREPEVTGKYVVQLTPQEVASRQTGPAPETEAPQAETTFVVKDDESNTGGGDESADAKNAAADEQRWDDNGGAGRPARPAAKKTTKNVPEPPPVKSAPDGF